MFAGHYFDLNEIHLKGDKLIEFNINNLKKLVTSKDNYVLQLHPLSKKKKRIIRPIED